jgi:F-type H+-transporting ATPase subunit a
MEAPEHEIALTRLFNDHLAGVGNSILTAIGLPAQHRPWANFITMQILVIAIMIVLFMVLRSRLSVDKPGKTQQIFEVIYQFLRGESEDQIGHDAHKYFGYFATVFIFILFCNLIGIIPGFESPTMTPSVPAGCALATFVYYNIAGIQANGVVTYLKHFAGPMWYLAPLIIPIEIISHMARPLSLTIRLYANMLAGEKVTTVFLGLTYFAVPALFMGLHVFVSFLQAYIFVLLTMMYVNGAVAHEH